MKNGANLQIDVKFSAPSALIKLCKHVRCVFRRICDVSSVIWGWDCFSRGTAFSERDWDWDWDWDWDCF
ncbi:MAG: hypothetical protein GY820_48400 [Gammaproteobacteria bacterium]|nr:hypothetical protein [Gammaproteobacteria bacterium]